MSILIQKKIFIIWKNKTNNNCVKCKKQPKQTTTFEKRKQFHTFDILSTHLSDHLKSSFGRDIRQVVTEHHNAQHHLDQSKYRIVCVLLVTPHATFDVTCFPAFVGALDVILSAVDTFTHSKLPIALLYNAIKLCHHISQVQRWGEDRGQWWGLHSRNWRRKSPHPRSDVLRLRLLPVFCWERCRQHTGHYAAESCPTEWVGFLYLSFKNGQFHNCQSWSFITVHGQF